MICVLSRFVCQDIVGQVTDYLHISLSVSDFSSQLDISLTINCNKLVKFLFHRQTAELEHGIVVIDVITSFTNTSKYLPWIKICLAPCSGVVAKYLLKRVCIKYSICLPNA